MEAARTRAPEVPVTTKCFDVRVLGFLLVFLLVLVLSPGNGLPFGFPLKPPNKGQPQKRQTHTQLAIGAIGMRNGMNRFGIP